MVKYCKYLEPLMTQEHSIRIIFSNEKFCIYCCLRNILNYEYI